jgi:hypothetical protein
MKWEEGTTTLGNLASIVVGEGIESWKTISKN